ncbi:hypothetical protein A5791_21490 [Mycobacterium sp. 852002-51163_SCH5372311]|uniref:phosphoribosylanthranilate isomerase n=1 Tax=Mycobacterium sp. 852002-51163_SCH5372311 TaxID=1834097 RepID=UPI0007FF96B4|nr:phosphoribosylanthranilate isomerase [Mycobacterium sp. 852002-51163_SCH5372311]OBF86388.1 hypothetical protein A5791_21490 [Mycobacterium sp. 852002-51163_SCH5372311]
MVRVRTKICGIGTAGDLDAAVAAGADAIGLIVGTTHISEDELSVQRAQQIASAAAPFVSTVLVTHVVSAEAILELADQVGVDVVQVHGEVSIDTMRAVWHHRRRPLRVIGTVHVTGEQAFATAQQVSEVCDAVLLDTRTDARLGGTGLTHDWTISRRIAEALHHDGHPVILAGGLDESNVSSAVRVVRPYGVDANSRLKGPEGRKDYAKCEAFVRAANSGVGR